MRMKHAVIPVVATFVLATPAAPAHAASAKASCVAQFAEGLAPHSAGAFGLLISDLTDVFEPNLGLGGVRVFAHAPRNDCP